MLMRTISTVIFSVCMHPCGDTRDFLFCSFLLCAHEGMAQFRCGGVIESFSLCFRVVLRICFPFWFKKKVLNNEEASWLVNDIP